MAEIVPQGQQPLETEGIKDKGMEHLANARNEVSTRAAAEGVSQVQGQVSTLETATADRPELKQLLQSGTAEQLQSYITAKSAELETHISQT